VFRVRCEILRNMKKNAGDNERGKSEEEGKGDTGGDGEGRRKRFRVFVGSIACKIRSKYVWRDVIRAGIYDSTSHFDFIIYVFAVNFSFAYSETTESHCHCQGIKLAKR